MMVQRFLRGWRRGRAAFLVLGFLAVGGLSLATAPFSPAGDAKDAEKKDDKKDAKPTAPAPPWPKPLDLVIVGKDDAHAAKIANNVKIINQKLEEGWKTEKVVPSRYADDYEFIRRASLDIIGRIATPDEIDQYMKDPEKKRRSMLIERLLASEDYPRHMANLWSNWLLTRSGAFGRGEYHDEMTLWLEDQFASNTHYDQMVRSLLTAEGENTKNGAVNFVLAHVGEKVSNKDEADLVQKDGHFQMVPLTSRITKLFLGTQVQCAQCHDHPFYNNIKQKDFWGVNAFLRQVDRDGTPPDPTMGKNMAKPGPLKLKDDTAVNVDAKVYFEKRNGVVQIAKAEFLPGAEDKRGRLVGDDGKPVQGKTRREMLADYVVSHPMFPKEIVNRMWGVFFGKGFANPVDDFNDQNKPSNPELLDTLAESFKNEANYDQKELIRWICNSDAYNLSSVANSTNDSADKEVLFSRMLLKSMSPEQLFESLTLATKAEAGESKDAKKDAKAKWLDTLIGNFGDDEGNEVNFNGTIVQALLMMNGSDINDAINREDKGTVALALKKHGDSPKAVITDLFLATLNRKPTDKEVATIMSKLPLVRPKVEAEDKGKPERKYQDLLWALVNSNEFLLNH
jgi:hypothetical protein